MKRNIQIMISSRCERPIQKRDGSTLKFRDLRAEIKSIFEQQCLFGNPLFEIWINEADDSLSDLRPSKEVCLEKARSSDILIVLYAGDAGWVPAGDSIGICHLEVLTAAEEDPKKVIFVELDRKHWPQKPNRSDSLFQDYVKGANFFQGGSIASTFEDVLEKVKREIVPKMSSLLSSKRLRRRTQGETFGESLAWSQLSFHQRKDEMIVALLRCLSLEKTGDAQISYIEIIDSGMPTKVIGICHALPDSFTLTREYLGRPQHFETKIIGHLSGKTFIGPIHLVACHNNMTDRQIRNVIGNSDCVVIKGKFGTYAAERETGLQIIFLNDCADSCRIAAQLQTLQEWIQFSRIGSDMIVLARLKSTILLAIDAAKSSYTEIEKKFVA